ncbi:MAG: leucyl aminopeptidase, partial [Myxococcota bacterium]
HDGVRWQHVGAVLAEAAAERRARSLTVALEESMMEDQMDAIRGLVMGIGLASYRFDKYKTPSEEEPIVALEEVTLQFSKRNTPEEKELFYQYVMDAQVMVESICAARDLVNEPPCSLTPTTFTQRAQDMAKNYGLKCQTFDQDKLESMGMNMFVAVGKGSDQPSTLVRLTYKPKGRLKRGMPKVALVGKGITFDAGGICIKSAEYMEGMHADMAGAAAVFGAMQAVAQIQPPFVVEGYLALAENMTGASAFKMNDVLRAYNKKTVEILHTDAEGRLVLGDTLAYACEQGATHVVDVATLTGACVVALGEHTAGLMGNDSKFTKILLKAGEESGESLWQLPLQPRIGEQLKSEVADLRNVGTRMGGAISAGLFLQEFIAENVQWAHLDIAGPSMASTAYGIHRKGGTGFGVATLVYLIKELSVST